MRNEEKDSASIKIVSINVNTRKRQEKKSRKMKISWDVLHARPSVQKTLGNAKILILYALPTC